jgi:mannose-1-phosphate guanylyltransferase
MRATGGGTGEVARSFFQLSLERALAVHPAHSMVIITREQYVAMVRDECDAFIKTRNDTEAEYLRKTLIILGEPRARHTAVAVLLACALFKSFVRLSDKRTILVLTSDHLIAPLAVFSEDCKSALRLAEQSRFVCFAIKPDFPSTGFGYIETDQSETADNNDGRAVVSFHEKPDAATAARYIERGNYWWNSGMFAFSDATFIDEIKKYSPEIYNAFTMLSKTEPETDKKSAIRTIYRWNERDAVYNAVPSLSIDTGIAEKTQRASCVIARFSWSDVGTWDAFSEEISEEGAQTKIQKIASDNCFVYADIPVALCGVSDLIVVIKNNQALIIKKGTSDLVSLVDKTNDNTRG